MSFLSRNRLSVSVIAVLVLLGALLTLLAGDKIFWRVQFLLAKAAGEFPAVTWSESFKWMMPNSPVYLDRLLTDPNPHVALTNTRYVSPEDVDNGRQSFRRHCASCHGGGGEGANGPVLTKRHDARSDWAVYRTIQRGIPGTSMPAHDLPDIELWQIITYLSSIAEQTQVDRRIPDRKTNEVSFDRIRNRNSEQNNWLTYSGRLEGWRYSTLDQINHENAGRLSLSWMYQSSTAHNKIETNPLVVDGVMYITEPPGRVVALDAGSGKVLWSFSPMVPETPLLCCGVVNRGVAVLDDVVYVATIDAKLLALDAATGRLLWESVVADYRQGYSITSAPLALPGIIVTGVAGGETGTRGRLLAFDAVSGEIRWRFDTVPEQDHKGADSWKSDAWRYGGAATWMTGSYDPDTDILYWGTSHSVHEPDASAYPGDKLYGSSLVALRGKTGELLWHFQATPNDVHGFDAAQVPVVADQVIDGISRRVLANANRNGFFYLLDAQSGEFLHGKAFANQTWADGLDSQGRPIVNSQALPTPEGNLVWPNSVGATNWWPPTYNPDLRLLCVPVVDGPSVYYLQDATYVPGKAFVRVVGQQRPGEPAKRYIRCLSLDTGNLVWEAGLGQGAGNIVMSGLLSTRGGVLFAGDDREFIALNMESGEKLWRVNTGGSIWAAPVTYSIGERQYIAVASGRSLLVFSTGE